MRVRCNCCEMYFDDEFRITFCPHDTGEFPYDINFARHDESYLKPIPVESIPDDGECVFGSFHGFNHAKPA